LVSVTWAAVPCRADGPEAPVWTDGDFWKYEGSIQAEGMTIDITMKLEVSGTEQISVKGTVYECYHMDGTASMKVQGMTLSLEMDMWARVSDIASVRVRTSVLGQTTSISYHPPVSYPWPLQVGDEWNGTTTIITQSSQIGDSEETVDYTAEVERLTSITVPAGTYETYEVRLTMQGTDSRNYYAPEVGYDIRVRSSELFGSDSPIELVDFKFGSTTPGGAGALDLIWYILIIVIVIVVAVAILTWRMRRKATAWPMEMPPQQPPEQPPQEPPPPPDW
jgi:hypothetical protein